MNLLNDHDPGWKGSSIHKQHGSWILRIYPFVRTCYTSTPTHGRPFRESPASEYSGNTRKTIKYTLEKIINRKWKNTLGNDCKNKFGQLFLLWKKATFFKELREISRQKNKLHQMNAHKHTAISIVFNMRKCEKWNILIDSLVSSSICWIWSSSQIYLKIWFIFLIFVWWAQKPWKSKTDRNFFEKTKIMEISTKKQKHVMEISMKNKAIQTSRKIMERRCLLTLPVRCRKRWKNSKRLHNFYEQTKLKLLPHHQAQNDENISNFVWVLVNRHKWIAKKLSKNRNFCSKLVKFRNCQHFESDT